MISKIQKSIRLCRGLDNRVYYMLAPEGQYYNYSGCGNTMNCNHPQVRQFILDSLRYWVLEMHVDGFRFDLASIMTRAPSLWHDSDVTPRAEDNRLETQSDPPYHLDESAGEDGLPERESSSPGRQEPLLSDERRGIRVTSLAMMIIFLSWEGFWPTYSNELQSLCQPAFEFSFRVLGRFTGPT